jgi:uncharacterized protein (DUF342 family)
MIKLDVTASRAKLSFSPDGAGRTISTDAIVEKLTEAGVCCGILDAAIARIVDQNIRLERAIEDAVVARQIEPQAGRSAAIKHILSHDQIAAAGDVVAELGEPIAAVDGTTIFGAAIKADSPPATVLVPGANTRLVGTTKLESSIYGKVTVNNKVVSVEPLVSVDEDKLTAYMSIHPKSAAGTPISAEMAQKSIETAGVIYGVDEQKLQALIDEAVKTDSVLLRQAVAHGRPAIDGDDSRVEFFSEIDQAIGGEREDGSVDFRERGTIRNLKAGVKICRRIPPTAGQSQVDVYGLVDFAKPGKEKLFKAGANVEQRGEEFWSMIDGAVMVRDNVVTVSDVYLVPGDIDLSTGNLQHDKGALQINGTVRSGFKAYAATHIMVGKLVEDAQLESGGDIEISGGVIHAGNGSIWAKGNVTAKFAQNARIHAGGDIVINGAAMNCELYAGSLIVVAGAKARLAGGFAHATRGLQVDQLGSDLGAPTRVEIDLDRRAIQSLESQIREIEAAVATGEASEADLEKPREQLGALMDAAVRKGAIIVTGSVYPGVTVTIFGAHRTFTEESRHCKIWLDKDHEIQVSPQ